MTRSRHVLVSLVSLSAPALAQEVAAPSSAPLVEATAATAATAQAESAPLAPKPEPLKVDAAKPEAREHREKWYDKLSIRGYTQVRYNGLLQNEPTLVYPQADKSIGGNAGFLIRRARLQLLGDVHPRVYLYFQNDFAADAGTTMHVGQIRDLYADIALDDDKEYRFRVGQSKVPFGFENMQSSSNRAPIDRTEALNSATPGERDLGVFFYWAPKEIRARFKHLVDSGLKGSGDYGVVGVGVYNGQGVNRAELTPSRFAVARVSWPFDFGGQIVEAGVQAMHGDIAVAKSKVTVRGADFTPTSSTMNRREKRAAASLTVYPQPIGFQAEAVLGRAPVFDLDERAIKTDTIWGYYGMLFAKVDAFVPFVRYAQYEGSRRTDTNAMPTSSTETEGGFEYQYNKAVEITLAWQHATRFHQKLLRDVTGDFARVQIQLNY